VFRQGRKDRKDSKAQTEKDNADNKADYRFWNIGFVDETDHYTGSLLSGYKLNSFSWLAGQGKLFSELIC
jgi:hypothetical protein